MDGGSRVPPATRARGGSCSTKLPFDAKGTPRVRFSGRRVGPRASVGRPRGRGVADARLTPAAARGPVGGTRARHAFEAHARADPKRAGPPAECSRSSRKMRDRLAISQRRRRRRRAMGGRAGDALLAREARARRGADAHVRGSGRARERSAKNGDGGDGGQRGAARAGRARARQAASVAVLELASLELASLELASSLPRSWTTAREAGPAWTRTRARRRRRRSCRWRPSRRWRTKGTSRSPCPRPRRRMRVFGDAADRSGARRRENLNPLGAVSRFARILRLGRRLCSRTSRRREKRRGLKRKKEEKGVAGVPRWRASGAVSSSSTSSSTPRARR